VVRLTAAVAALAVAAGTLSLCTGLSGCRRPVARPNILLYVVDTLRADALHCYGNGTVHTPAMDSLAAAGIRFTRAYANASWTRASMGSLLTGEYPNTHGAVGRADALGTGIPTLASQLAAAGYQTAAVISNPNIGATFGFATGFGEFIELFDPHPQRNAVMPEELIARADTVVDRAIDWLHHRSSAPFFLLVFTVDPHTPYMPPAPYDTMYDPDYTGQVDGSFRSLFGLALLGHVPPEREIRHLLALYHGEVTFNDAQLSRLFAELDRLDLGRDTVVVVTSDHGEEFYEHGGRDHGHSLYEELIRVPLIMRWPGMISPGTVFPGVVQLADLYPTLLRFAAASATAGAGRNLAAVVTGRQQDGIAPMAYAEEKLDKHDLQALVLADRKLIHEAQHPEPLIFDLARDAGEQHPQSEPPPPDLVHRLTEIRAKNHPPAASSPRAVADLPESVRRAMEALGYGDAGTHPMGASTPGGPPTVAP
jgi:arylsulfatase A-like enzyme